jgi:hypothetical protein
MISFAVTRELSVFFRLFVEFVAALGELAAREE